MVTLGKYTVQLYTNDESHDILYTHQATDNAAEVYALLPSPKPILAVIDGIDWNDDLSPWSAPKAFRGGEDFAGGASAYLKDLTEIIIPQTEQQLGFLPQRRSIVGYSLAGLFAVWALYQTDIFQLAASMSGSLWFDGFSEYMQTHPLQSVPEKLYFSLGDREHKTKSPRMAAVEACTRAAVTHFRESGIQTDFVLNKGGHFQDVPQRIADGIAALYGYNNH